MSARLDAMRTASAAAGTTYRNRTTLGIIRPVDGVTTLPTGEGKAGATLSGWHTKPTTRNNKSTRGARRAGRVRISDAPEGYPTGTTFENASHQPSAGVTGGPSFEMSDDPSNDKARAEINADRVKRATATRKANKAAAAETAEENAKLEKRARDNAARERQREIERPRERAAVTGERPQDDGPLSKVEATALFRAAMGAMHRARAAGDNTLADSLHNRARAYRRVMNRATQVPAPAMPDTSALTAVPAKNIPADLKEIARIVVPESGWAVLGAPRKCGGVVCRLYVRRHGANVRYAEFHDCQQGE